MGCAHKQRWQRRPGWGAAGPTLGRQMLSIDNAVGYTRPQAIDGGQKTPAATPLVTRHWLSLRCVQQDAQHAAQWLGGAPQQLVTNRERTDILRAHGQFADA